MDALKYLPWYQCPDSRAYHPEIVLSKGQNIWCGGYPFRIVSTCGLEADIEESARACLAIKLGQKKYLKCRFIRSGLQCEIHDYGYPYQISSAGTYDWQAIKEHIAWLNRHRESA